MIVPYEKLSAKALRGLIEEFVTRPGTDTGYMEGGLENNVEMVMMQLKLGDVFIVYDESTQTANLVPKQMVKSHLKEK
ncbi:MAG: YheU family protein [Deltaproteobacteria bacterium]|nr:YheU family protein [Deltaproteobacteria bacterium]